MVQKLLRPFTVKCQCSFKNHIFLTIKKKIYLFLLCLSVRVCVYLLHTQLSRVIYLYLKMYRPISLFISGSPFLAPRLEMRVNGKGNLNNTPHFFVYDFPSNMAPFPSLQRHPEPATRLRPFRSAAVTGGIGHAVLLLIWRRRQETISRLQQKPR